MDGLVRIHELVGFAIGSVIKPIWITDYSGFTTVQCSCACTRCVHFSPTSNGDAPARQQNCGDASRACGKNSGSTRMKEQAEKIWWKGVRHIFSPTSVTKFELVQMINDVYKLNNTVLPLETKYTTNKTLNSIHDDNSHFNIPELNIQIEELFNVAFL